ASLSGGQRFLFSNPFTAGVSLLFQLVGLLMIASLPSARRLLLQRVHDFLHLLQVLLATRFRLPRRIGGEGVQSAPPPLVGKSRFEGSRFRVPLAEGPVDFQDVRRFTGLLEQELNDPEPGESREGVSFPAPGDPEATITKLREQP